MAVCLAHLAITSCDNPPIYVLRILYCSALAGIFGASLTFVSGRAPAARIAEMVGVVGTAGFLGQMLGTALGDLLIRGETIEPWQTDLMFVVAALLGVASMPLAYFATRHLPPPVRRERLSLGDYLRRYNPGTVLLIAAAAGIGLCLPHDIPADVHRRVGHPAHGPVLRHLRAGGDHHARHHPALARAVRAGADDPAGHLRAGCQPVDVPAGQRRVAIARAGHRLRDFPRDIVPVDHCGRDAPFARASPRHGHVADAGRVGHRGLGRAGGRGDRAIQRRCRAAALSDDVRRPRRGDARRRRLLRPDLPPQVAAAARRHARTARRTVGRIRRTSRGRGEKWQA